MVDTNFGYGNHDFSSILETIKRYYPVDHPESFSGENIEDFPGLKEMGDLTGDNFFKQKNYRERWVKFRKFLKQELKLPVAETMIADFPCYCRLTGKWAI